jgi:hypothetical protein
MSLLVAISPSIKSKRSPWAASVPSAVRSQAKAPIAIMKPLPMAAGAGRGVPEGSMAFDCASDLARVETQTGERFDDLALLVGEVREQRIGQEVDGGLDPIAVRWVVSLES